ncbi:hypothetical protein D9V86_01105 [Bacteroidetes/Chlorobi group bacterium ChocPot_Mid]|jgi:hypothetical protein|nr:MAG: hypothetical protein D9V86_01105 [Bacteroidetes/Chlorobi group bacterium ChocPot_Mid]
MSNPITLNSDFNNLLGKQSIPIGLAIMFLILTFGLIAFGTIGENYYISIAVFATIPLVFLMIRYPRFWIYTILITNIYFFYSRDKEVSVVEILIAIQYLGTLAIWFFWEILVKREKIIRNIADLFFMFFLFIVILNGVIAYLNSVEMLYWAREAANLSLVSIYFPIRKYFPEKKHLKVLLIIYSIVVTVSSFLHLYTYSKVLQGDLYYAYQLMQGIRVNQTLFTAAAVFGFVFALYNKNKIITVLLILFTSISVIGLITSFSRTFWVILLAQLVLVIFYLTGKQRVKLLIYSLIAIIILSSTLFFAFEEKSKVMVKLIENRFVSAGKGTKDISVQARFAEYEQVWKGIYQYPLGGNGLARKFDFWNILDSQTTHARFIHNGYLFIMFRMGIPVLIVFLIPYFYYLVIGERLARKSKDEFFRLLSIGSFMAILLMLISNFTAAQLIQREAVFVTALAFAFIGIASDKQKSEVIE